MKSILTTVNRFFPPSLLWLVFMLSCTSNWGFSSGTNGKKKTHLLMQETQETWVRSLGQEDPLEAGMATHFSILAWRIPWTEEPGGLQRVGHD